MMPKSGARFDRCPDDQRNTLQSPVVLAAVESLMVEVFSAPAPAAPLHAAHDGASFEIDRPPRA